MAMVLQEAADNWTTQLRKGVLELCILNIIGRSRVYGYDIVKQLRGVDALVVREGTIYPILSRLKRDGLVLYIARRIFGRARQEVLRADASW